ncbi:5-carboxymethyl-2-hydroxymuconate isomerase [Chromatiales bacterium (ex Bugula neritina AB1)]|nr:5-carboxymethyl-2-hydroxymuconate isomerase [Chromatiales bacterium (ex Bugula neritina AB1)]
MPHFSFEYSANLDQQVDFKAMSAKILATALETGFFEIGAVRVRGVRCDVYTVADDMPENSFIDLSLRLGEGRSETDKKTIGDAIFAMLEEFLQPQLAAPHFALSFEIRVINSALSWKRNAIHPRLRNS